MSGAAEVVVRPGELYFGGAPTRLRTLLGSCIAVTLWHPQRRLGGMCHFVVPSRGATGPWRDGPTDARYGDEAMELLRRAAVRAGTQISDYDARVYGGGRQFAGSGPAARIGVPDRNVAAARTLTAINGLRVLTSDVGGYGARMVVLDLATGLVEARAAGVDARSAS